MDSPPNPTSLDSSKREQTPDTLDGEPPERKTAQTLFVADKNFLKMYLLLWATTVEDKSGILGEDMILD